MHTLTELQQAYLVHICKCLFVLPHERNTQWSHTLLLVVSGKGSQVGGTFLTHWMQLVSPCMSYDSTWSSLQQFMLQGFYPLTTGWLSRLTQHAVTICVTELLGAGACPLKFRQ